MKKIRIVNDIPYFEVDNEIIYPVAYMTYIPCKAKYESFYKAGFRLYCISIQASSYPINEESGLSHGFSSEIWKDEDTFDFSVLDESLSELFKQTGDREVKVILRINLNMSRWWREKYPEELSRFENGRTLMQSVFSQKWREDSCVFLKELKQHIDNAGYSNNIIAWQPAAMHTEEWIAPDIEGFVGDFSKPAQKAYMSYLKTKYSDIESLNKAWQEFYSDFDEISIPSNDELIGYDSQTGQKSRDYFICLNDAYADAANYYCSYIKRIFDGDIFTGCFSGYIAQLPKTKGHCSFHKLLHSKDVDFFASPFAYTGARANSVDWIYHAPMESAKMAGKLWFIEADVRTHLTKNLMESSPELFSEKVSYYVDNSVWYGPDKKNSIWNIIRSFSKLFISRNAFWWFDMWGGWFEDRDYLMLIEKLRFIYEKEIGKTIHPSTEIAVFLDENSSYYLSDKEFYHGVYDRIVSLGYIGAPYDLFDCEFISMCDLKRYKSIVFCSPVMTPQLRNIFTELKAAGKTVIITGVDDSECNSLPGLPLSDSDMFSLIANSGVHIYSKSSIVYANSKYLSVTACKDGSLEINMQNDCNLVDCITKKRYYTTNKVVLLEAESNQSFLFEIT